MKNLIKKKKYRFLVGAVIGGVIFLSPNFVWAQGQEEMPVAGGGIQKVDTAQIEQGMKEIAIKDPELFKEMAKDLKDEAKQEGVEFSSKDGGTTKDAREVVKEVEIAATEEKLKDQGVSPEVAQKQATQEQAKQEPAVQEQAKQEPAVQEQAKQEQVAPEQVAPEQVAPEPVAHAPVDLSNVQDKADAAAAANSLQKSFDNPTDAQTYADSIGGTVHDHGNDPAIDPSTVDPSQRYHVHPPGCTTC